MNKYKKIFLQITFLLAALVLIGFLMQNKVFNMLNSTLERMIARQTADMSIVAEERFNQELAELKFAANYLAAHKDVETEKADDVKYWFQSYRICKATNLQFVFYHSTRSNKDILFKILWNGKEATIPALEPVTGPYYRWDDFFAYAQRIMAEHPEISLMSEKL